MGWISILKIGYQPVDQWFSTHVLWCPFTGLLPNFYSYVQFIFAKTQDAYYYSAIWQIKHFVKEII